MENTMQVRFTFDENLIEKDGYTRADIYNTIKKSFEEKNISCVSDGEILSFAGGARENDFSYMWAIILRLTKTDWFLKFATSCIWCENDKWEDVLRQAKAKKAVIA